MKDGITQGVQVTMIKNSTINIWKI